MIYKKENIETTFLLQEIIDLSENEFLPKARKFIAEKKLESLNTNGKWWIRMFYIFLGFMSLGFAYSFFDLTILDSMNKSFPVLFFVQGLITYGILEYLVREKKYFNHGISDAFLLSSFGQIIFFISYIFNYQNTLAVLFISSIISTFLAYRFVNIFMAAILFCSLCGFHFYLLLEIGEIGKLLLPFSSMLFAGIILFGIKKIKETEDYFFYYEACINCIEILSFVVLYLSGNYLVVRMGSESLMNIRISDDEDITMAWFFNLFTLVVPLIYIYLGIKSKSKILLYIGVAAVFFAAYTIRTYHHVLPTEIALLIGGLFLFCVAYFVIKKLKDKTVGITFEPDNFETEFGFNEMETFATAVNFGIEVNPEEFKFGGGKFGGGGAGSKF